MNPATSKEDLRLGELLERITAEQASQIGEALPIGTELNLGEQFTAYYRLMRNLGYTNKEAKEFYRLAQ